MPNIPKKYENTWNKAVDAFKKQYKHEPKSDKEFAIVSSIFDKMGGKFNENIYGFVDKFMENKNMSWKEKLNLFKEMKKVQFQKELSDDEIERYCKKNNCTVIMISNKNNKTTLTVSESLNWEEKIALLKEASVGDKHQLKILIGTVKNPNRYLLGGPTADEAKKILKKKFNYTDKMIKKLEESLNYEEKLELLKEDSLEDELKKYGIIDKKGYIIQMPEEGIWVKKVNKYLKQHPDKASHNLKESWIRDKSGIFKNGEYSIWLGTRNNIYLSDNTQQQIIYKGKDSKSAGKMFKIALKLKPSQLYVPSWYWNYEESFNSFKEVLSKDKIKQILIKGGFSKNDIDKMIKTQFDYVNRVYGPQGITNNKAASIISTLWSKESLSWEEKIALLKEGGIQKQKKGFVAFDKIPSIEIMKKLGIKKTGKKTIYDRDIYKMDYLNWSPSQQYDAFKDYGKIAKDIRTIWTDGKDTFSRSRESLLEAMRLDNDQNDAIEDTKYTYNMESFKEMKIKKHKNWDIVTNTSSRVELKQKNGNKTITVKHLPGEGLWTDNVYNYRKPNFEQDFATYGVYTGPVVAPCKDMQSAIRYANKLMQKYGENFKGENTTIKKESLNWEEKIKMMKEDYDVVKQKGKIIMIASSGGGKYKMILKEDDLIINGKIAYVVLDMQNNSQRGKDIIEGSLSQVKQKFKQMINDWNKKNTKISPLKIIKESLSEATRLDNDQNDVLEGIVSNNRKKSNDEILKIVMKDPLYKGINKKVLLDAIEDTKNTYHWESWEEKIASLKETVSNKFDNNNDLKNNMLQLEKQLLKVTGAKKVNINKSGGSVGNVTLIDVSKDINENTIKKIVPRIFEYVNEQKETGMIFFKFYITDFLKESVNNMSLKQYIDNLKDDFKDLYNSISYNTIKTEQDYIKFVMNMKKDAEDYLKELKRYPITE